MTYRPQAYTLVSTDHGSMIVNRFDYKMIDEAHGYGVGFQLLNTGQYDMQEINLAKFILNRRLQNYGPGVVAIDCGANIGVHTIEWAKMLHQQGTVIAFEPQEAVYYALCGNIALNNCFNVSAYNSAVSDKSDLMDMPKPNYFQPSTFGSMELKQKEGSEDIGQELKETTKVESVALSNLPLNRCDFIKIDVEGMEFEALDGAQGLIELCKPVMLIEFIKVDKDKLEKRLADSGYSAYQFGGNFLAIHESDKMASDVSVEDDKLRIG
jgi:FkbM family methyltransferase